MLGNPPATRPACLQKRQVTRYSNLVGLLSDRSPFGGVGEVGVVEVLRRFRAQPFSGSDFMYGHLTQTTPDAILCCVGALLAEQRSECTEQIPPCWERQE
jgi:hypothetical protein